MAPFKDAADRLADRYEDQQGSRRPDRSQGTAKEFAPNTSKSLMEDRESMGPRLRASVNGTQKAPGGSSAHFHKSITEDARRVAEVGAR